MTAEDFEELARTAAPDAARVRCVTVGEARGAPGVRLLVVPKAAPDATGALPAEQILRPPTELLKRIASYLDARRLVGTRLLVAPPEYRGSTVVARLTARAPGQADDARRAAARALYDYLSPLTGGPDGDGWPFGRPVQLFEVSAVLAGVPGIGGVEEVIALPRRPRHRAAWRADATPRHRQGRAHPVVPASGAGDMRGTVPGLASPHPLGETLPSIYAGDSFAQRLCLGLDEVLAPVLATLNCLPAYLDPATAPADLTEWLAGWVGVAVMRGLPDQRWRQLVATAARLYASRGTLTAIRTVIQISTGQIPEIRESGGAAWSPEPIDTLPGWAHAELVIFLRGADLTASNCALATTAKPHYDGRSNAPVGEVR